MVLPRWLATTNRRLTNRILGRIPDRFSPFATLHHVGRRSGTEYSVPLAAFSTETGYLLTPTYGPEADWVQNLLAADSFVLERRGRRTVLTDARLVDRTIAWPYLPRVVRFAMRVLRVHWYVAADRT